MSMHESSYSALVPGGYQMPLGPAVILEPGPEVVIEEETYSVEALEAVRAIEPGSYALMRGAMDPEVLESFDPTATFNEIPDLGRTRANSVHGVMFGQLLLQSPFGDERAELVAVKPLDLPRDAAHELSLARYFSAESRFGQQFHTFTPMGVLRQNDGTYGVISRYEHGVRSLDNVFYNPDINNDSVLLQRSIGKCATLLASMHAQGFAHGDAQVKNMFVSNHSELFIADLESVRAFRMTRGGQYDELDAERRVMGDLVTIAQSMFKGREELLLETPQIPEAFFGFIYYTIINSPQSQLPMYARKSLRELQEIFTDPYAEN